MNLLDRIDAYINEEDKNPSGKEVAAKMRKNKAFKGSEGMIKKVEKMQSVSYDDLENMLPDYIAGSAITSVLGGK